MNATSSHRLAAVGGHDQRLSRRIARHATEGICATVIIAGFAVLSDPTAHAAAPAGTMVGNQGSMEFVDADGVRRSVASNFVEIEVLQVFSADLQGGLDKVAASGGTVVFPHTLINSGNGDDSFSLSAVDAAGDDFDFTTIQIFADNGSGQPTGDPITDPVVLAAGDRFNFVVVGTLPDGVTPDSVGVIDVQVTSVGDANVSDNNEDRALVSDDAIVEIRKALSDSSGTPGSGGYSISLTIDNVSTADASNVVVTDVLAEGYAYVAESGSWSEDGAALTDADGGDATGINYSWDPASRTIRFEISSVTASSDQTISFDFAIASGTEAGDLDNTATMSFEDGSGGAPVNSDSNTVSFNVEQVGAPDADDQNPDGSQTSGTDDDGTPRNDNTVVDSAPQGGDVPFEVIVTNNGNGDDVFNVEVPSDDFPPGTVFTIFRADGKTPLVDTDGDGIPDTGSLEPGESTAVFVVATLPEDALGDNDGNGFDATILVTSAFDGTVDTVTATLSEIAAANVDLTNDRSLNDGADAGDGAGTGPETDPIRSVATDPNSAATFALVVNNLGGSGENYVLSADTDADFTVVYYLDDGDGIRNAGDTVISDNKTGVVPANGSVLVFADVTPSSDTAAGNYPVDFTVISPRTGATDTISDELVVNAVTDVSLNGGDSGSVTPGGQITYQHQLVNNGSTEAVVDLTTDNSADGWTSEVYIDTNGDGVIGPEDTLVTGPITVGIGETLDLLVLVTSPTGSTNGDNNSTTLSGNVNGEAINSVVDSTVVSSGTASLSKEQAVDNDCDGNVDTPYSSDPLTGAPGECVSYRLRGTNDGATTLTDILISDFTPAFTAYTNCGGACPATASNGGQITAPSDGSEGGVSLSRSELAPGESDTLTFSVQLEP